MAKILISERHNSIGFSVDETFYGALITPLWKRSSDHHVAVDLPDHDSLLFEEALATFESLAGNLWTWILEIELGNLDCAHDEHKPLCGYIVRFKGAIDASKVQIDADGDEATSDGVLSDMIPEKVKREVAWRFAQCLMRGDRDNMEWMDSVSIY